MADMWGGRHSDGNSDIRTINEIVEIVAGEAKSAVRRPAINLAAIAQGQAAALWHNQNRLSLISNSLAF